MKCIFNILAFCFCILGFSQYAFSGYVNKDDWQNIVYLSIVEDYRKLNGIYSEQIIAKTKIDSTGFFEFKGNMLDVDNRIYRIHVDKCPESELGIYHFNGDCGDSKFLTFIANNTDTVKLPFSFDNEIFCHIQSTNPKANTLVKIDSIKADMRFAYGEFPSEASRKLNHKKWFKTFQDFGKSLKEPLAELYIYSYLSERSGELYNFYKKDLNTNSYYNDLKTRLEAKYPNSVYANQYNLELAADKYTFQSNSRAQTHNTIIVIAILLTLSLVINGLFIWQKIQQKRQKKSKLLARLSKQEAKVLELILKNNSNKAIAEQLFLSLSTVKTHTNTIYKKLGVNSRSQVKSLFN